MTHTIPPLREAVLDLWRYTSLADEQRGEEPADLGLALGCHDPAVADRAARLRLDGRFARLVFSGGSSPATRALYPEGEAVAFARRALAAGVSPRDVIIETKATNTAENFTHTRALLESLAVEVSSGVIVTRPYHQRRALLTAQYHWPDVAWQTTTSECDFDAYRMQLGDTERVISYVVGEVLRIASYRERGMFGVMDEALPTVPTVPTHLLTAAENLAASGYAGRPVS